MLKLITTNHEINDISVTHAINPEFCNLRAAWEGGWFNDAIHNPDEVAAYAVAAALMHMHRVSHFTTFLSDQRRPP